MAALRKAGIEITAHETLKTAPKGYPKDHPRIELLRQKGLIAWKQWPVGRLAGHGQGEAAGRRLPRRRPPAQRWLDKHVGPSAMPPR